MLFYKLLTRCPGILLLTLLCFAGFGKSADKSLIKNYSLHIAGANPAEHPSQYDKAIADAQKSLRLAQKNNSQAGKIEALTVLAKSYAAKNDFKQAYNYQVQLKNVSDSMYKNDKNAKVNSLSLKRQQEDNARLVNEIKTKEQFIVFGKKLFWIRNVLATIVVIFIVIIIRNNRQKSGLNKVLQKQNADIAAQKAEITRQKETLHQLNHTKDQLFSVISHDLRSPFAAILQAMDDMKAGDLSAEERKEVMNAFYQQLSLVTMMVNNLLVWAGSQQSGNKTQLDTIDAADVIDEIIAISNFLAKSKRISLKHIPGNGGLVLADSNHLKIIFNNLIGNAIKFTPNGGTIEISYTDEADYQAIHVKDNGIGILPQKMEKLFKVTGKDISCYGTNNEAGAGIGLGLIKQFVDANNGRIEVKSQPGEGAEFIVYLEKAG